jgi:tRNA (guanine37-N1)-methyltransferase
VPEVLRSGNHAEISVWRQKESERLTKERRPDLWEKFEESHSE